MVKRKASKKLKPERKQPEVEKVKAFAVKVSEQFWGRHRAIFERQAMDFPDLVQECAKEFYRVKHRYNPKYKLATFAYVVMRNRLRTIITLAIAQKRSGKTTSLDSLMEDKKDRKLLEDKTWCHEGSPIQTGLSKEKAEKIRKVFRQSGLSELEQRRIVKLFLEEKTVKQVALEEGVTSYAVSTSGRAALKKMRANPRARELLDWL